MRTITTALCLCLSLAALPAIAQDDSGPGGPYLDDRTNAAMVISSYYNAINRREYARAWSYWGDGVPGQSYEDFSKGYANTDKVAIMLGTAVSEGAAGSVYTSQPVAISATDADGNVTTFAGCYLLRLAQPSIQEPPFQPLHIEKAELKRVSGDYKAAVPADCAF